MPDLTTGPYSYVAANYRKSFAPFTLFGTRQLRFYNIYVNGLNVNHPDNGGDHNFANQYEYEFGGPAGWDGQDGSPNYSVDSAFARAITGIQTQAEIYGVWHPEANDENSPSSDSYFTVMVAGDTHADRSWDQNGIGDNSITMQDAIENALQGYNFDYVNVYQAYISGDYMDRDIGSSIARGTNKMSSSPEAQATADALKAARAAARPKKA